MGGGGGRFTQIVEVLVSGQPRTGDSSAVLRCFNTACIVTLARPLPYPARFIPAESLARETDPIFNLSLNYFLEKWYRPDSVHTVNYSVHTVFRSVHTAIAILPISLQVKAGLRPEFVGGKLGG